MLSRTEQSLDAHGNVLETRQYDHGNLSTPVRTYTHTYLTGTTYSSRHIWNRLVSATLSDGTNTVTLVTNAYDQGSITNRTGLYEQRPIALSRTSSDPETKKGCSPLVWHPFV